MSQHLSIEETVCRLLTRALQSARRAPAAPLTGNTTLSELGVGSMMLLELTSEIEDLLAIQLPIDDVARSRTVGELIGLVQMSVASCATR